MARNQNAPDPKGVYARSRRDWNLPNLTFFEVAGQAVAPNGFFFIFLFNNSPQPNALAVYEIQITCQSAVTVFAGIDPGRETSTPAGVGVPLDPTEKPALGLISAMETPVFSFNNQFSRSWPTVGNGLSIDRDYPIAVIPNGFSFSLTMQANPKGMDATLVWGPYYS